MCHPTPLHDVVLDNDGAAIITSLARSLIVLRMYSSSGVISSSDSLLSASMTRRLFAGFAGASSPSSSASAAAGPGELGGGAAAGLARPSATVVEAAGPTPLPGASAVRGAGGIATDALLPVCTNVSVYKRHVPTIASTRFLAEAMKRHNRQCLWCWTSGSRSLANQKRAVCRIQSHSMPKLTLP